MHISGRRWGRGLIRHSGYRADEHRVRTLHGRELNPTVSFLILVAVFATAAGIVHVGLPTPRVLLHVVSFGNDSVAERCAAMSISNADEFLELLREDPGLGIHAYQVLVAGSRIYSREFGEHFDFFNMFRGELCFHLFEG